jgi:hypothetical protein
MSWNPRASGQSARPFGRAPAAAVIVASLLLFAACGGRTPGPDAIGVPECDEYVVRMQACVTRDPGAKAMEPAFRAQRDAWKQMVRGDRATVQANCKVALQSLAAGNCR